MAGNDIVYSLLVVCLGGHTLYPWSTVYIYLSLRGWNNSSPLRVPPVQWSSLIVDVLGRARYGKPILGQKGFQEERMTYFMR